MAFNEFNDSDMLLSTSAAISEALAGNFQSDGFLPQNSSDDDEADEFGDDDEKEFDNDGNADYHEAGEYVGLHPNHHAHARRKLGLAALSNDFARVHR